MAGPKATSMAFEMVRKRYEPEGQDFSNRLWRDYPQLRANYTAWAEMILEGEDVPTEGGLTPEIMQRIEARA
jgi:hypothetical protein